MSGTSIGRQIVLIETDFRHGIPSVPNVAGRAPEISADVRSPLPYVRASILAKAKHDWMSYRLKRVAHLLVDGLHVLVLVDVPCPAPVVLQIVDAPCRVAFRVL